MITFEEDTPRWIKEWATWAAGVLIPEWDVFVIMVDKLEDHEDFGPHRNGEIDVSSENLRADVKFKRELKDSHESRVSVVHEFCHAFVCRMSESAQHLISSKVVGRTAWKGYDAAEEETVVRLSRILVNLKQMDDKS